MGVSSNKEGDEPWESPDARLRIARLKDELRRLGIEPLEVFESPDAPPQMLEAFWREVLRREGAGRRGFEPPTGT